MGRCLARVSKIFGDLGTMTGNIKPATPPWEWQRLALWGGNTTEACPRGDLGDLGRITSLWKPPESPLLPVTIPPGFHDFRHERDHPLYQRLLHLSSRRVTSCGDIHLTVASRHSLPHKTLSAAPAKIMFLQTPRLFVKTERCVHGKNMEN